MSTITEKTMHLGIEEMQSIFGQHDKYIRKIEDNLKVEIIDRSGELHIIGDKDSVKQAYDAIHGDELRAQAVAYGMDRTRQQLGQTIQAQQARPGEGAMSGKNQAAAAEPKINPANMTRKDREAYKRMIRKGVPISFD